MEKEIDIKLSLKKEEEIKTSMNNLIESIPINNTINFPNLYQITNSQLESLVTKYTDSNDISDLFNYINSLGGTDIILEKLLTSSDKGIKSEENRKEYFGVNKVFEEPMTPFFKFLKESLCELMIIILLSAATLQVIIGVTISEEKNMDGLTVRVFFVLFLLLFLLSLSRIGKKKKNFMN